MEMLILIDGMGTELQGGSRSSWDALASCLGHHGMPWPVVSPEAKIPPCSVKWEWSYLTLWEVTIKHVTVSPAPNSIPVHTPDTPSNTLLAFSVAVALEGLLSRP